MARRVGVACLLCTSALALTTISRRGALASLVASTAVLGEQPRRAAAAEDLIDVYFGVGCGLPPSADALGMDDDSTLGASGMRVPPAPPVAAAPPRASERGVPPPPFAQEFESGGGDRWLLGRPSQVQHELVEAERKLLGRSDDGLITARAGYAGGSRVGKDTSRPGERLVCYHNLQQIADYGRLGHGEVVGLKIPPAAVGDFAGEYSKLFVNGDRPDKGDRGPEYRSLIGLPGGMDGPYFTPVAKRLPDFALLKGKGDDGDTLGKRQIWVYDTADFPFHAGEVYHQFHDGFFPGENYPKQYNDLASRLYKAGKLDSSVTGCPDIV